MPFYDYQCTTCGATLELFHGIEDQTQRAHEGCGGALERRFTAASVHFKGSGWAKLERRGDSGTASTATSPTTTPTAGSTSGSADRSSSTSPGPTKAGGE